MKLTKTKLKQIIKEELAILQEREANIKSPATGDDIISKYLRMKDSTAAAFTDWKEDPDARVKNTIGSIVYNLALHSIPKHYQYSAKLKKEMTELENMASPLAEEALADIQAVIDYYEDQKRR